MLENNEKLSPDRLQALRAIEALEQIGSPDARKVLDTLAKGMPESRQTREAKAALDRLQQRPRDDRP